MRKLPQTIAVLSGALALCTASTHLQPLRGAHAQSDGGSARPIIGWLDSNCLVLDGASLPTGTRLFLVTPDATASVLRATLGQPTRDEATCAPLRPDRRSGNDSPSTTFYLVSVAKGQEAPSLSIGVVAAAPVSLKNGRLDLNGDGKPERFAQCAMSEGNLQFSVWSGAPYKGKPMWIGYYFLGYDTDQDCPHP